MRDTDRARVYDAEQLVRNAFDRADETGVRTVEIHGSRLTLPVERRFASVESIQAYADKVLALNWVRAQFPRAAVPVHVRERAGTTAAHYEAPTATIAVPLRGHPWAAREFVILHELAHHLCDPAAVPHGPAFRTTYVALADGVIAPEAAFLLHTSLLSCGLTEN